MKLRAFSIFLIVFEAIVGPLAAASDGGSHYPNCPPMRKGPNKEALRAAWDSSGKDHDMILDEYAQYKCKRMDQENFLDNLAHANDAATDATADCHCDVTTPSGDDPEVAARLKEARRIKAAAQDALDDAEDRLARAKKREARAERDFDDDRGGGRDDGRYVGQAAGPNGIASLLGNPMIQGALVGGLAGFGLASLFGSGNQGVQQGPGFMGALRPGGPQGMPLYGRQGIAQFPGGFGGVGFGGGGGQGIPPYYPAPGGFNSSSSLGAVGGLGGAAGYQGSGFGGGVFNLGGANIYNGSSGTSSTVPLVMPYIH